MMTTFIRDLPVVVNTMIGLIKLYLSRAAISISRCWDGHCSDLSFHYFNEYYFCWLLRLVDLVQSFETCIFCSWVFVLRVRQEYWVFWNMS